MTQKRSRRPRPALREERVVLLQGGRERAERLLARGGEGAQGEGLVAAVDRVDPHALPEPRTQLPAARMRDPEEGERLPRAFVVVGRRDVEHPARGAAEAHGGLVVVVVLEGEPVADEEAAVALAAVAVVDGLARGEGPERGHHEGAGLVVVGPVGLRRVPVVQHVGEGDEGLRLLSVDGEAEDAARHGEAGVEEARIGEAAEAGDAGVEGLVVVLDGGAAGLDLGEGHRAVEEREVVLAEEEGKGRERAGEGVEVGAPRGAGRDPLVEDERGDQRVRAAKRSRARGDGAAHGGATGDCGGEETSARDLEDGVTGGETALRVHTAAGARLVPDDEGREAPASACEPAAKAIHGPASSRSVHVSSRDHRARHRGA